MGKPLLFVTWDSDQSNYLESLFFPILKGIQEEKGIQCHVMQFSWASPKEVARIQNLAQESGIQYVHHRVHRKPLVALGALWAVYQGSFLIKKYIDEHEVRILMPRSTMPALMVNRLWDWLKSREVKVVFDADGFPLEERVDFSGLKTSSNQYKFLKSEESKIVECSDRVLTRSKKSIDIHLGNNPLLGRQKFFVVSNGRDAEFFKFNEEQRQSIRKSLGVRQEELLWVYSGSLGPAYLVEEMIAVFAQYLERGGKAKFLFLTRSPEYLESRIPKSIKDQIIIKTGSFTDVPGYLSASDLGLSLRSSAPSLAGLAPIKLGEYLLCGLPVLASKGVGDTEEILSEKDFAFFYENGKEEVFFNWLDTSRNLDRNAIRSFGIEYFSLSRSVDKYLEALNF